MKHLRENPSHESSILTSAKFASAAQMISLAQACNKLIYKPDGQYIVSPFHGISRHIVDTTTTVEIKNNGSILSGNFSGTGCAQTNSVNLVLDSGHLGDTAA